MANYPLTDVAYSDFPYYEMTLDTEDESIIAIVMEETEDSFIIGQCFHQILVLSKDENTGKLYCNPTIEVSGNSDTKRIFKSTVLKMKQVMPEFEKPLLEILLQGEDISMISSLPVRKVRGLKERLAAMILGFEPSKDWLELSGQALAKYEKKTGKPVTRKVNSEESDAEGDIFSHTSTELYLSDLGFDLTLLDLTDKVVVSNDMDKIH